MNLKFAITREDYLIEKEIIETYSLNNPLIVASGGCTILGLKSVWPNINISAFDFNPNQIDHCKQKIVFSHQNNTKALNINHLNDNAFNQSGEFEDLFKLFRKFFELFIAKDNQIELFFNKNTKPNLRIQIIKFWINNPYFSALFTSVFHDDLLIAMFSESAIQHAAKQSYPSYFKQQITKGLLQENAHTNPWLQHILLGYFIDADYYCTQFDTKSIQFITGTLLDVPNITQYDFLSLSNIFDWSSVDEIKLWAKTCSILKQNSIILIRQLNSQVDLSQYFTDFSIEHELMDRLLITDRSLFYNSFLVLRKNK